MSFGTSPLAPGKTPSEASFGPSKVRSVPSEMFDQAPEAAAPARRLLATSAAARCPALPSAHLPSIFCRPFIHSVDLLSAWQPTKICLQALVGADDRVPLETRAEPDGSMPGKTNIPNDSREYCARVAVTRLKRTGLRCYMPVFFLLPLAPPSSTYRAVHLWTRDVLPTP